MISMASLSVGVNPIPSFPLTILLTDTLPSLFTSRKSNQALIFSKRKWNIYNIAAQIKKTIIRKESYNVLNTQFFLLRV